MTTYLGSLGAMAPVECFSALDISREARHVLGGGAGTLAPVRARVAGPPSRAWGASVRGGLANDAVLASLARRQARAGGALRCVPCDALDHNMFTPAASEDLSGWTGLVGTAVPSAALVTLDEAWPAVVGRVAAGSTATSPRVPVVAAGTIYAAVHATGSLTTRVVVRDSAGTQKKTASLQHTGTSTLARSGFVAVTVDPSSGHFTVEVQVSNAAGQPERAIAWPSIAYARNPYTTGRAADAVLLVQGSQSIHHTFDAGFAESSWQIVEVGA